MKIRQQSFQKTWCLLLTNSQNLFFQRIVRYRLSKTAQIFVISLVRAFVLLVGIPCISCHAAEKITQHEITTEIRWISDEYTYGDYIVNGESFPTVSGHIKSDYYHVTSSYSFFFTPIPEDELSPIALERFYSHPSNLRIYFSLQPEEETTHTFQNPENNFSSSTFTNKRSRSAGLDVEYYLRKDTGLLLYLSSTKNEEDVRTSDVLGNHGIGENDEIQRYYGFGLSQYVFEDLNIKLMYTTFDFEYITTEKTWGEDNPILSIESGREADTEGWKISFMTEYMLKKFWGISGIYEFWEQKSHSNLFSPYYNNLSDSDLFYDDDTTNHTLGTSVTLYFTQKTTCHIGGRLAWQKQERVYETDQIIEYDGDSMAIEAGIAHYINRHIAVQMGYEFTKRNGDVLIWHPETETDPRTEYQAQTDFHAFHIGITGRF